MDRLTMEMTGYIMKNKNLPTISVITPTLNAARQIDEAFRRIREQHYPQELVEIIIADGGSNDNTRKIAEKYAGRILENRLITSEAGKAVGVKAAVGEYILLLDSDNYVVGKNWLRQAVAPMIEDQSIVGSEPLTFTARPTDGIITRYTAMMGMGDPLMYFLGTYDRSCILSSKWTGLPIKFENKGNYLKLHLERGPIPTIGANGTMLRRTVFDNVKIGDYLFDIDILAELIDKTGVVYFAKTKSEIIHAFSSTFGMFVRKQRRRIRDFFYFQSLGTRSFPWQKTNKSGLLVFILYTVLIFPVLGQSIIGFIKKPDIAWFFHPLACWSTFIIYGWGQLERSWRKPAMESRQGWKQG